MWLRHLAACDSALMGLADAVWGTRMFVQRELNDITAIRSSEYAVPLSEPYERTNGSLLRGNGRECLRPFAGPPSPLLASFTVTGRSTPRTSGSFHTWLSAVPMTLL